MRKNYEPSNGCEHSYIIANRDYFECLCGKVFESRKELGEHLIWWYLNK